MEKIKEQIALKAFDSGFNCAQSVIRANAFQYEFNLEQAMHLSSGFGGGMGKLQNTCGAVSGAYMLIGFHNAGKIYDPEERKAKNIEMIQAFSQKFKAIHGATDCRTLLNCDINTVKGKEAFKNEKLGEKVCQNCILSSLDILDELTNSEL